MVGGAAGTGTALAGGGAAWALTQALYSRLGQRFAAEGMEPAVRKLLAEGHTADRSSRSHPKYGPDATLALARGSAESVADQRRAMEQLRKHMADGGGLTTADRALLQRLRSATPASATQ